MDKHQTKYLRGNINVMPHLFVKRLIKRQKFKNSINNNSVLRKE
jgi:hypothetical protein